MKNHTESKWPNKAEPLPGATRRAASATPPAHSQPAEPESQEKAQPSAETENAPTHSVSVPFMITHQMEASLREGGFSQEWINAMTPSEAWEILQAEAGRIATELSKFDRDGAIKSEQDASFYANLIRIFDATYTGPVGSTSPDHAILTDEQLVPPPPEGLSAEERAAYYQADLENAIGAEYIDRNYQPQVFQSRRSPARKKKCSPRKLQK